VGAAGSLTGAEQQLLQHQAASSLTLAQRSLQQAASAEVVCYINMPLSLCCGGCL
jgi:hypothetical protein